MVLAAGLWLAVAGLAIGLIGAMAPSRVIASFLYETSPLDPLIYAAVIAVLLGVTLLAIPDARTSGGAGGSDDCAARSVAASLS
jgi:hypothetical protein